MGATCQCSVTAIAGVAGFVERRYRSGRAEHVGRKFGELQAALFDAGKPAPEMDLLIAATALVHDLTLVTHNVRDFANVPGLMVQDWLNP